MADRADACGAVQIDADVVALLERGRAGVQAHANLERELLRPGVRQVGALSRHGRRHRLTRVGERGTKLVPTRVDLVAVVPGDGLAHQPPVVGDRARVVVAQTLDEPRGVLHVAEEEGDFPGRERAGHEGRV